MQLKCTSRIPRSFLTCLIKKFGGSINLICSDLAQCQTSNRCCCKLAVWSDTRRQCCTITPASAEWGTLRRHGADALLTSSALQGRPQLRLQKSYQFQVQKTNPKTSLLYLLVLIMPIFPFLLCWCKPAIEALRGSPRPGRSQARPGEAWARPRHGRKRIGTRTKRGSWGLETI